MTRILPTFFTFLAVALLAGVISAQDTRSADPQQMPHQRSGGGPDMRANFLRGLGLSDEQIQQIRQLNVERRPLMEAAQKHLREANRALDAAIYADQVVDADFEARLRDVQSSQAEVSRLRYENELAVRRVLTPEQLVRFRELRQQFENNRRDRRDRQKDVDRPTDGRGPGRHRPADANRTEL